MASWRDFILVSITVMIIFVCANSQLIENYNQSSGPIQVDIEALQALKLYVYSDPSGALANWDHAGNHVCNWTGVSCNPQKLRVMELNLYNRSLQGTIPPHLGNMSFLGVLNLTLNHFSGAIPPELGRLHRLERLVIRNNNLTSSIPKALKDCTALTILRLSNNHLTGGIPSDLGQLQKLQNLDVNGNRLRGKVPESLGNCSAMEILDLGNNLLSGTIPSQLGLLAKIQILFLGKNSLTGGIPPSLLNCTELVQLYLFNNTLSGEIPWEIGTRLSKLEKLVVWGNELNGTIPKSLGNCSQLSWLMLSENSLTGSIPQEFGKLRLLQQLWLYGNRLVSAESIPIFETLSNCTNLQTLNLCKNDLSGELTGSIGQLSQNLSELDLSENLFTGKIPQEISNLAGLYTLSLRHNFLSGDVHSALGRLSTLQLLDLSENNLEGTVPNQFSQLKALDQLYLSRNMFSGKIPDIFASLQRLRKLDLSYNKFSGNIPESIGRSSSLELLDLSYNQLTGVMPLQLASLHNLQSYISLSHNALTGRLPAELGGMQMIQKIDLSANNFSGTIPEQLGNCAGLERLNLSHNSLEGLIPASIDKLEGLQDMDLSFNQMSGPLPLSIEKLGMLRNLNLSYNNFVGEIPSSGAFRKLNFTSFLGNTGLCGRWIELPPCKLNHHDSNRRIVILVASVASGLLLVILLTVLICFRRRKSEAIKDRSGTMLRSQLRETKTVSEEEVKRATNGFSPDNLLGRGGHGSVYKGVLEDGTTVAVKVIHSDTSGGAYKRLIKECKTLGSVRHRNLVRIIGVCSSFHVKSLVMEFMSQGSLDKHLHYSENNSKLGLKRRLSILKEVAHGMSYLHHDCSPAIAHCDLKPSNILLDTTMTAHVGDFGISRLMNSTAGHDDSTAGSGDTSNLVIGTIGYTPPEYGVGGRVSTKGDVYSYGILVLETMARKRPTDPMFSGERHSGSTLQSWMGEAFPDRLLEVIDGDLVEEIRKEVEEVEREEESLAELNAGRKAIEGYGIAAWLVKIGLMCTKESPRERPTIREIEALLEQLVAAEDFDNWWSSIEKTISIV